MPPFGIPEGIMLDLRLALRVLRRSPGFVLTAVATLALAVGANSAIFSLISAVLLEPLPYPRPEQLLQFWFSTQQGDSLILSMPSVRAIWAETDLFDGVAAYDFGGPGVTVSGGGEPEQVPAIHVSEPYFRLLGARVSAGRHFTPEEDRPRGGNHAVISHALWQRRFGGDASLPGRSIRLGGEPYVVVGVLAPGFRSDPPADVWFPLQADPASTSQASYLRVIGRLRDGVTLDQVNSRLGLAYKSMLREFPLLNKEARFRAKPMQETQTGDVRTSFLVLLGVVIFVLLIACVNVANLLLARATTREHEFAVKAAIGASRRQLVGQLLIEACLLALAGGAAGLWLGQVLLRWLVTLNPDLLPGVAVVALDWRVLVFTGGIVLAVTLLCGLWPAWRASTVNLAVGMNGGRMSEGRPAAGVKAALIAAEVGLAVVLVTGAVLMAGTFVALRETNPGVATAKILTLPMSLQGSRYRTTADVTGLMQRGVERLRATPGVLAVATTWTLPVENCFGSTFIIEGRPLPAGEGVHGPTMMRPVSPDYALVFGIALRRGRFFTAQDRANSGPVAFISEAMANKHWPGRDPTGEYIRLDPFHPEFAAPPRQIIGVTADVRAAGLRSDPAPLVYVPQSQVPEGMTAIDLKILPLTWVVKTSTEPYAMLPAVSRELTAASGGLAIGRGRSMEDVVRQGTSRTDFNTLLIGGFAALALLLAAIGVYGLMNYTVAQRAREFRIRMALGATHWQVWTLVIAQASKLTTIGIAVGAVASLWLTRWIESMLFGVQPADPAAILLACAAIGTVALTAAALAAHRAAGLDARDALSAEGRER
ncbi:MAG: ABC transporter permease [Acidobacteria bacterium]|nr:ABC transporter permease [Acidobacteriota bacterium]